jgi:hypothetical protein
MPQLQAILLISWGVVTAVLIVLLVYRSILSSREDAQIFIDSPSQHHFQFVGGQPASVHFQEQQEITAKISRLTKPILALSAASAVLILAGLSVWAYRGLAKP